MIMNFLNSPKIAKVLNARQQQLKTNEEIILLLEDSKELMYKMYFAFFSLRMVDDKETLNKLLYLSLTIGNALLNRKFIDKYNFEEAAKFIHVYSEINFYDMTIMFLRHVDLIIKALKDDNLKVFNAEQTKAVSRYIYAISNFFKNSQP